MLLNHPTRSLREMYDSKAPDYLDTDEEEDMERKALAPGIEREMGRCRRDLGRLMDDMDYCNSCPLLQHCVDQHDDEEEAADGMQILDEWCQKEERDAR